MEIAEAHCRRLRRRQAVTAVQFIDGCDILPQSPQCNFQLHGGHADLTKNAVDDALPGEVKSVTSFISEGDSHNQGNKSYYVKCARWCG